MKVAILGAALAVLAAAAAQAQGPTSMLAGPGGGPVINAQRLCSDDNLYAHHDGTFEHGISWQMAGVVDPYGGAFGEGYDLGPGTVECFSVWISQDGYNAGQSTDVYVWDNGVSGLPGSVLGVVTGVVFQSIPIWPSIGRFDVEIAASVSGAFTIGSWGNWPEGLPGYWWMADGNGAPGHPWTYVVPGLGHPEGWQDPGEMWAITITSMAIGVHFTPDDPTPAAATSWGRVKQLYADVAPE
jgi:hypothetical protein